MNVINVEFGTVTSTLREASEFIMQPDSWLKISYSEYRSSFWKDLQSVQKDNCRSANDWSLRIWRSSRKNPNRDRCIFCSRKHESEDIPYWPRILVCTKVVIQDIPEDKNTLRGPRCYDIGCLAHMVRASMDLSLLLELKMHFMIYWISLHIISWLSFKTFIRD